MLETNTSSAAARPPILAPICTYRNASEFFTHNLTLTRVNPSANLDAESLDRGGNRPTAADRTRRTIKGDQKTIARRIDLATAMPRKLLSNKQVMLSEKVFPCAVGKFDHSRGGANDIRKKYACEHAVKIGLNFSATAGQERFNLTED